MLHSGSRGVGNRMGSYFIEVARKDMQKFFINLPDKDLAYFSEGTEHFDDYVEAVEWAQDFARWNRHLMMEQIVGAVRESGEVRPFIAELKAINCHHNYVARERHYGQNILVTRKGAVRAREGDMGIIPGSMGARSYIVRGKGNMESFMSCSHGAGRAMSRGEAKRRFTVEDHHTHDRWSGVQKRCGCDRRDPSRLQVDRIGHGCPGGFGGNCSHFAPGGVRERVAGFR